MTAFQVAYRWIAILLIQSSILMTNSVAWAENKRSSQDKDLKIYMPYSANKDHLVIGREIRWYQMRYDLAQESGIFMILLPEGYTSPRETRVYFAIDTLSLDGGSLGNLYEHDLQGIQQNEPRVKILRKDLVPEPTRTGPVWGRN